MSNINKENKSFGLNAMSTFVNPNGSTSQHAGINQAALSVKHQAVNEYTSMNQLNLNVGSQESKTDLELTTNEKSTHTFIIKNLIEVDDKVVTKDSNNESMNVFHDNNKSSAIQKEKKSETYYSKYLSSTYSATANIGQMNIIRGLTERQQLALAMKVSSDTMHAKNDSSQGDCNDSKPGSRHHTESLVTEEEEPSSSDQNSLSDDYSSVMSLELKQSQQNCVTRKRRSRGLPHKPDSYSSWPKAKKRNWDNLGRNPNSFYMKYCTPNETLFTGEWTADDTKEFISLAIVHPPCAMWGLFSMLHFPTRNGRQCLQLYYDLKVEGILKGDADGNMIKLKQKRQSKNSIKSRIRKRRKMNSEDTDAVILIDQDVIMIRDNSTDSPNNEKPECSDSNYSTNSTSKVSSVIDIDTTDKNEDCTKEMNQMIVLGDEKIKKLEVASSAESSFKSKTSSSTFATPSSLPQIKKSMKSICVPIYKPVSIKAASASLSDFLTTPIMVKKRSKFNRAKSLSSSVNKDLMRKRNLSVTPVSMMPLRRTSSSVSEHKDDTTEPPTSRDIIDVVAEKENEDEEEKDEEDIESPDKSLPIDTISDILDETATAAAAKVLDVSDGTDSGEEEISFLSTNNRNICPKRRYGNLKRAAMERANSIHCMPYSKKRKFKITPNRLFETKIVGKNRPPSNWKPLSNATLPETPASAVTQFTPRVVTPVDSLDIILKGQQMERENFHLKFQVECDRLRISLVDTIQGLRQRAKLNESCTISGAPVRYTNGCLMLRGRTARERGTNRCYNVLKPSSNRRNKNNDIVLSPIITQFALRKNELLRVARHEANFIENSHRTRLQMVLNAEKSYIDPYNMVPKMEVVFPYSIIKVAVEI